MNEIIQLLHGAAKAYSDAMDSFLLPSSNFLTVKGQVFDVNFKEPAPSYIGIMKHMSGDSTVFFDRIAITTERVVLPKDVSVTYLNDVIIGATQHFEYLVKTDFAEVMPDVNDQRQMKIRKLQDEIAKLQGNEKS